MEGCDIQKPEFWAPVTPEKRIPVKSNLIIPLHTPENQQESASWEQLTGIYGHFLRQDGCDMQLQNSNHGEVLQEAAGFDTQNVVTAQSRSVGCNAGPKENPVSEFEHWNPKPSGELLDSNGYASASMMPNKRIRVMDMFTCPDSCSQLGSKGNAGNLLLTHQHQNLCSTQQINSGSLSQMPKDGSFPYLPVHNPVSPSISEVDEVSHGATLFPSTLVTPDPRKQFHLSEELIYSTKESSSGETGLEALVFNCYELSKSIMESSSSALDATLNNKNDCENGCDRDIDLNKTPPQKTPKRKKHRPKVVIEGKPKRTPRKKANNSSEKPAGKRKYVRRKGLETSGTPQKEITVEVSVSPTRYEAKSCRRVLNFAADSEPREESNGSPDNVTSTSGNQEYVMKTSLATTTQQADLGNDNITYTAGFGSNSGKGVLNLNLENEECDKILARQTSQVTEMNGVSRPFELGLDSCAGELQQQIHDAPETKPSAHNGLHYKYIIDNQKATNTSNYIPLVNNILFGSMQLPEQHAPLAPLPNLNGHPLNIVTPTMNTMSGIQSQTNGMNISSQVHHPTFFQAENVAKFCGERNKLVLNGTSSLLKNDMTLLNRIRTERDYYQSNKCTQPCNLPLMASPNQLQEMFKVDGCRDYCQNANYIQTSNVPSTAFPKSNQELFEAEKYMNEGCNHKKHLECSTKKKTQNKFIPTASSVFSCTEAIKGSHQPDTRSFITTNASSYVSEMGEKMFSSFDRRTSPQKLSNGPSATAINSRIQPLKAELNLRKQEIHGLNLHCCLPLEGHPSRHMQEIKNTCTIVHNSEQRMSLTSYSQECSREKILQEQNITHYDEQTFMQEIGSLKNQKAPLCLDEITLQLKGINGESNFGKDLYALVPYKGDDRLVPYEGRNQIKKQKPRPKVDLDHETNRVWNILMGKESSESTDAVDKGSEQWWEEERRVFRGRVESFIARMHLVQGDRRFKRWKGSVVDSVIGVFLTQNVSDHLSSSAFMSLVSRFPLCSRNFNQTCYASGTRGMFEQSTVQMQEAASMINHLKVIPEHPGYGQNYHESFWLGTNTVRYSDSFSPPNTENSLSSIESNLEADQIIGHKSYTIHDIPRNYPQTGRTSIFKRIQGHYPWSLQSDQMPVQGHQMLSTPGFDRQWSSLDCSEYNSNTSSNSAFSSKSGIFNLRGWNMLLNNTSSNAVPGSDKAGTECFRPSGHPSIPSFNSTTSDDRKERTSSSMSNRIQCVQEANSRLTDQQNGVPGILIPNMPLFESLNNHSLNQGHLGSRFHVLNNQQAIDNRQGEKSKTFIPAVMYPTEGTETWAMKKIGVTKPPSHDRTAQTSITEEVNDFKDEMKLSRTDTTETDKNEQFNSSNRILREETNNSKTRKRSIEVEKQKAFDWDALRRQVIPIGEKRERSTDMMDSLNYEALRRADVSEISNAIKERGMNNRLAERIKDFLNRLVTEHRSIDLEWLRDVPPDSAKDYLLSIRGLGLKSVECVRLLTLHHLAFPVDTNVGRIAVRLGWVPLQPLPESLELHLLELYPILESVQKFLWPRLCKLDQLTLYELHYQMITFGKVFCTKTKPNCNACPMRGECRHFASAYASARLALPGQEEKRIIDSATSVVTDQTPLASMKPIELPHGADQNPSWLIKSMALPLFGNSTHTMEGYINGNCEPIIEEPKTPEPEVLESDIEDAFFEDSDEIPTIKLDMEEFATNLQNYIQENNMELEEKDMSKALVVLDSQAAYIPVQKLKNVSRLRTEHQVYELPDSHPLLKELYRREPDDPSPYLLAIWTPGETANSVHIYESKCNFHASGEVCNDKTCFACNGARETDIHTVRGTILIPCRTAMRGSFPLNGTYFQVNEVFADHKSSLHPIDVPRQWIWKLPRRIVYFGTSVSSIFRGLTTQEIQHCFWRGFVCVRGFEQRTGAPRPLVARLHFPISKSAKTKKEDQKEGFTIPRKFTDYLPRSPY